MIAAREGGEPVVLVRSSTRRDPSPVKAQSVPDGKFVHAVASTPWLKCYYLRLLDRLLDGHMRVLTSSAKFQAIRSTGQSDREPLRYISLSRFEMSDDVVHFELRSHFYAGWRIPARLSNPEQPEVCSCMSFMLAKAWIPPRGASSNGHGM